MARTDKDTPYAVRLARGEVGHSGNWGVQSSTNWRKARREIKREGNKAIRRGKTRFYDTKTVRTAIYYL